MNGPLTGLRVVELVGQGPGPFGGLVLSHLGADVVGVDRPGGTINRLFAQGKQIVTLDLKASDDREVLLGLMDKADAFIDPFRPGVCERLGVGPDVALSRNPRLIYGRMTGFGQTGPLATVAGHDINYIAMSGALSLLGTEGGPPQPPMNLLGDFAGGGMMLALGIMSAVYERATSGTGQVLDVAMVDGATLIALPLWTARLNGAWGERGTNQLDGGAHFYGVYECSDGGYVSVGAIEPQFYRELLTRLGLEPDEYPQHDRARWPEFKATIADIFLTRSRAEWCEALEGTETCFAPVLSPAEAVAHPHHQARGAYPQAAPRFDRTPGLSGRPHTDVSNAARTGTLWS